MYSSFRLIPSIIKDISLDTHLSNPDIHWLDLCGIQNTIQPHFNMQATDNNYYLQTINS
jgi:hypothetical protein